MQRLQLVMREILRNLGVYLSIAVSIVVVILDIFGVVDSAVVNSAILAVLALVSGSLLVSRREAEKTREVLLTLGSNSVLKNGLIRKQFELQKLLAMFASAERVMISGTGHTVLVPIMNDEFADGLPTGLHMRFLLMAPDGDANRVAAFRAQESPEDSTHKYERNLMLLNTLARRTPEQRLEIKTLDYLPGYNIFAIDPHLPSGVLYAHLSSWRSSMVNRPLIVMTKREHLEWFEYFVDQFETMWRDADAWEPSSVDVPA